MDWLYKKESIDMLKTNPHLATKVFSGVTHTLDYQDNPFQSIEVLKEIITEINLFLNTKQNDY